MGSPWLAGRCPSSICLKPFPGQEEEVWWKMHMLRTERSLMNNHHRKTDLGKNNISYCQLIVSRIVRSRHTQLKPSSYIPSLLRNIFLILQPPSFPAPKNAEQMWNGGCGQSLLLLFSLFLWTSVGSLPWESPSQTSQLWALPTDCSSSRAVPLWILSMEYSPLIKDCSCLGSLSQAVAPSRRLLLHKPSMNCSFLQG